MTEYVTGQIYGWNGDECPVHPKTVVKYWMYDSGEGVQMAGCLRWEHSSIVTDIIAFKVITPYAGPKTIWVNEYRDGVLAAYTSEEIAKTWGNEYHTRIAVEYVEKQK